MTIQTIQNSEAEDRDLFQLVCPHYQKMSDIIINELINMLQKERDTTIPIHLLEIWSWTGHTAKKFIEKLEEVGCKQNIILTLVDISAASMQLAQQKLANSSIPIEYYIGDIFAFLKTNSTYFSSIYSMFTLHNFHPKPRKKLIKNISNAISPGGLFINADKIASDDLDQHNVEISKTLQSYTLFKDIHREDLYNERVAHYKADDLIKRTEKEYIALLQENWLYTQTNYERLLMEKVIVSQKTSC